MATLRINEDHLAEVQAFRTTQQFAASIKMDPSTVSRVLNGKAEPGPRFIAALLTSYPHNFEYFFSVEDDAEAVAA